MEVEGRRILILGGTGLVGRAIARRLLPLAPERLVIAGLREEEARGAVEELRASAGTGNEDVELVAESGDIFRRREHRDRSRAELLSDDRRRAEVLEDTFGALDEAAFERSTLFRLVSRHEPHVLVDCINTATAIAYQDLFNSVAGLRRALDGAGGVDREIIESHLTTLYLPQLIRHVQILLEALRRARVAAYVKIGTSGTGGMGLNVPFTHSEERPSRTLLAKASIAGAHSLLLFLMARTPDAPAVAEIKPTAAIAWKRIGYGPILRDGRPIRRVDAREPVALDEAFGTEAPEAWRETDEPLESVFLDAGENGLFSLCEFETISSLGMMEVVTPEEIAGAVLDEIRGRPTGHDVVASLDGAAFGPTYRGGMMREAALGAMERLEREHDVRSVAFEMLGPPRLSKLLFEAAILRRLFDGVAAAAELDPEVTAREAEALLEGDGRFRSDILSVGIPIVLPGGERLLRGPTVKVLPPEGTDPSEARWADQGWVDLRSASWVRWRERCRGFVHEQASAAGAEGGSARDLDLRAASGEIRPGALAAYVFREEDRGERIKR